MGDLTYSGNLIEAGLWFIFTVVFLLKGWRTSARLRRLFFILAVAFLFFGVSDVIESRTGAWWRPIWLLLLKSACIMAFLYGVWEYRRIRRAEQKSNQPIVPA